MTLDEKFQLIEDWLERPMTEEENLIATRMLTEECSQFGGSNSPVVVARYLEMQRVAGNKKEESDGEQQS